MSVPFRSLLEMLKFTDASDLLTSYSHVSSFWHRTSLSEELWSSFCDQESVPKGAFPTYRAAFRDVFQDGLRSLVVHIPSYDTVAVYNVRANTAVRSVAITEKQLAWTFLFALLDRRTLLMCDGASSEVMSLHLATGEITPRRKMPNNGIHTYSASYPPFVYVFGGTGKTLASKYDPRADTWKKLPNMTVCQWYVCGLTVKPPCIYLIGGPYLRCEVFDTVSETYTKTDFMIQDTGTVVSFLHRGELKWLHQKAIYYWPANRRKPYFSTLKNRPEPP